MVKHYLWVFIFLLVSVSGAYAFSISIDPPSLYLTGKPGTSVVAKVSVENTSSDDVSVKVYYEDWTYNPDQTKLFLTPGKSRFSLKGSIKLYTENILLKGSASQDVYFEIKSPLSTVGGLYGVVFFETDLPSAPGIISTSSVKLVGRLGAIVYYTAEGTEKSGLSVTSSVTMDDAKPVAKLTFKNTGNTHLGLTGSALLVDRSKSVVERIPIESLRLLPGSDLSLSLPLKSKLAPGTYTILTTLRSTNSQEAVFSNQFPVVVK